jgi:phosphoenolpyruvate carboxykinase (diphosphate)
MELQSFLGIAANGGQPAQGAEALRRRQVSLHLLASGFPAPATGGAAEDAAFAAVAAGMLDAFREKARLLGQHRCPADQRIEAFLANHSADLNLPEPLRLPDGALVLDRHGLARELSLPAGADAFSSVMLKSYRLRNGVLHNPKADRRTTVGTFHVAEGGLGIPGDKRAVPKAVFAKLFAHAMAPPKELLTLPFHADGSGNGTEVRTFVSLLIRPMVCPAVPGICSAKSMEIRFFAPGSLVSNLDFVESIFGNGGDPFLMRNDAGLDVEHWTGHTGCVILAPHLTELTKKQLGLPHIDKATPRQKRDGMCWRDQTEKYNDGGAFKVTCRTDAGVVITLLADNYYGYCKKEVKTQISYAANLYGNVEEEHAGGAIAFPSYAFGDHYQTDSRKVNGRTFRDIVVDYLDMMHLKPQGYAVDKKYPNLIYIPESAEASVPRQQVWWMHNGKEEAIPLEPGKVYMTPSGFKLRIEKHPGAPSWRIIGTAAGGTFCHKPCTVSGGGKSEISKSLRDYMLYGPIFVADVEKDLDVVDEIFHRDYSTRWAPGAKTKPDYGKRQSRSILSPERTLGSVIKLLTPSSDYTDEYNAWLASVPNYIYPIVFIIKRFHKPQWDNQGGWRSRFGVDIVNGFPGHELKYNGRKLVGVYLRVGLVEPQAWRTFKVRQDFAAAAKLQTEDDISASVVLPIDGKSLKFAANCEYRLFQRPDDAIHRGLDKQTEADMSRPDNFLSNFEPLSADAVRRMVARVTEFGEFSDPMRDLLFAAAKAESGYVGCSANPRLVNGKPSANPRYLQVRPDLLDPMAGYVAEQGSRFLHIVPAGKPVLTPVDAVLIGRRNNPEDKEAKIRGLAVYNPLHYQELPELFMDFICSLTGKSPSTTGAGSEGALTKGPFNSLLPSIDLNNALVSYILTGLPGYSTAAGHIGPHVRVDHDLSLLIPEVWCRLSARERDPKYLIDNGFLEPLMDFEAGGEKILASRLGYRITYRFVRAFFGRVFDNPAKVFDEAILRPETQDREAFIDGIRNITEAQQRVGREYFEDDSFKTACPPLRVLLTIMAHGSFEGKDASHPEVRAMFTRGNLLASDWYRRRLATKQRRDEALWRRHIEYVDGYLANAMTRGDLEESVHIDLASRRSHAAAELARVRSAGYVDSLIGTIGANDL